MGAGGVVGGAGLLVAGGGTGRLCEGAGPTTAVLGFWFPLPFPPLLPPLPAPGIITVRADMFEDSTAMLAGSYCQAWT